MTPVAFCHERIFLDIWEIFSTDMSQISYIPLKKALAT